jgi:steroid 5-alpha reductase family enzyme
MESTVVILSLNLGVACSVMVVVWLFSLRLQDVSIVDIAWGASGALIALNTFFLTDGDMARRFLLTGMTVIWGGRLAFHIAVRKKGKGEDFRYAAMRAGHPETFPRRSLVTVFLLQAFLIWAISMPVQIGAASRIPTGLTLLDILGLGVWAVGFGFEALSDAQLQAFLSDPANKGSVMDRGLWRYSRHPNYFGDSLIWWGIFLMAAATPMGWVTFFSPLLMSFFLMKISGVPMLEKALGQRRKGYQKYMQRTSPFFPWPPRKERR